MRLDQSIGHTLEQTAGTYHSRHWNVCCHGHRCAGFGGSLADGGSFSIDVCARCPCRMVHTFALFDSATCIGLAHIV